MAKASTRKLRGLCLDHFRAWEITPAMGEEGRQVMSTTQLCKVCDSARPLLWGLGILVAAFGIAFAIRFVTGEKAKERGAKQAAPVR